MQRLFAALLGPLPPYLPRDGFGQSKADDERFQAEFRCCWRRPTTWRRPSAEEARSWDAHPIVGRFGDRTYAVAEVDGRRWVVRDRFLHGFPDPEQFAFFALDDEGVRAAADFDWWPRKWTLKEA